MIRSNTKHSLKSIARTAAPLLAIILPIVAYFSYLAAYGVNVPYWDDWELVPLLQHFNLGDITFTQLWAQHNENRMLIPNILSTFIYRLTAFDTKAAMYVGACLVTLSFLFLAFIFVKRQGFKLWALAPIAYLFFSLSTSQNILWGFQLAWHMVLICFLGMIFCLEQSGKNKGAFALSLLLAVIASFSSLQGLFLWPVGIIYLLLNDFTRAQKSTWVILGLLAIIFYFIGFNFHSTGGPPISYSLRHPLHSIQYLLVLIGGSIRWTSAKQPLWIARETIGLFLFLLGGFSIIQSLRHAHEDKAFLAPAALAIFALLFDAAVALGRAGFGLGQALESRYTTYNLLFLIAIYLTLFRLMSTAQDPPQRKRRSALFYSFLLVIIIQTALSCRQGLIVGRYRFHKRKVAQELLINYEVIPLLSIPMYLYYKPLDLQRKAAILQLYHLNVFSTWVGNALLPAPKPLQNLLQKDMSTYLAWKLLSTIYFFRPDLQKKYPPTTNLRDFSSQIAFWAIQYGLKSDKDAPLLQPYKKQFLQINAILQKGRSVKKRNERI